MTERKKLPITLEDVQSAVMVLKEFMAMQREAAMILAQFQRSQGRSSGGGGGFGMPSIEEIVKQVMDEKGRKTGEQVTPEPSMTEDDLERVRQITEKRKETKAPPSPK